MKNSKPEIPNLKPDQNANLEILKGEVRNRPQRGRLLALCCFFLLPSSFCLSTLAQGTAFTYQGRLNDGANPANGLYDLRFAIYDAPSAGGEQADAITNNATSVSNGLFTVTLDYGYKVFNGEDRWLEIGVRTSGGGAFTNLSPRQPITPTPYAIAAGNLTVPLPADQLSGTLSSAQLSGTYSSALTFNNGGNSFTGNGGGLTNLNASRLASGTVPDARLSTNVALLNANATFLGNVQALGDLNGLRLNVGTDHVLSGAASSITGGDENVNGGPYSTIAGGQANVIQPGGWSFIGAGYNNHIGNGAYACSIGSGEENTIADGIFFGTIGGGVLNSIAADSRGSTIGGGEHNAIATNTIWSTIAGGDHNVIGTNSDRSTVGGGEFNKIAGGSYFATIAGGIANDIGTNSYGSVVSGGNDNNVGNGSAYCVIGGGINNNIGSNSYATFIGGGQQNSVSANASYAAIPGGQGNIAATYAFAAGFNARATNLGAFVWSDSNGILTGSTNNNSVTMRASGGYRFFTGVGAAGAQLLAGATSWSVLSDRNLKKDFQPVDCEGILEKLARIPVTQWHYTWENKSDPMNLGPMAQDFKAAFYPGRDDKTISTLEIDGVTLAAVQGLNEKVEGRMKNAELKSQRLEERLQQREAEIAELQQTVNELKELVKTLNQKVK